jgi:hypothetical protein
MRYGFALCVGIEMGSIPCSRRREHGSDGFSSAQAAMRSSITGLITRGRSTLKSSKKEVFCFFLHFIKAGKRNK